MKKIYLALMVLLGIHLVAEEAAFPAHILEPLGTEISATPPRGRMFGQIEYLYSKDEPKVGPEIKTHLLPLEFEIGVGERTQLSFEAVMLLEEKEGRTGMTEDGIEEMAFGLKHRFWDESNSLPDAAYLVEFAPAAGLNGNEAELKGTVLLTKNVTRRFLVHLETGILHETERESEADLPTGAVETHVHTKNFYVYNVAPVFRLIPEKLLLAAELNGETHFKEAVSKITLAPEVIYVVRDTALKLRVPFGLTEDSPDIGVHFGVSKLF